MAFPYVDQSTLERRLDIDPATLGKSDSEWQTLLTETLETESARVEGDAYAAADWRDSVYSIEDVPHVVRDAVIRLSRASIHEIESAGLESENTGDGASYNYRSAAQVREAVRVELSEHDFTPGDGDPASGQPGLRSDLI